MKYKKGDILKHKTGGPKMIVIGYSYFSDERWYDWEIRGESEQGYLCRFYIPKNAEINVANALSSGYSSASARASGQGSYETGHFFEYELVNTKKNNLVSLKE